MMQLLESIGAAMDDAKAADRAMLRTRIIDTQELLRDLRRRYVDAGGEILLDVADDPADETRIVTDDERAMLLDDDAHAPHQTDSSQILADEDVDRLRVEAESSAPERWDGMS